MKKISFLSTLLASMVAFTACIETPIQEVAKPSGYEPDEVVTAALNITAEEYAQPIVISDESAETINAFTLDLSSTPVMPDGTTFEYTLAMSATDDMANALDLAVVIEGNMAKVATAELDENVKLMFGKRPQSNTFYSQLAAYCKQPDGRMIKLLSNVITAAVTPQAMPIENAYYLIGDMPGWDFGAAANYPFSHSDKDVYEDPIFTIVVNIPSAPSNWKVVPQSGIDNASWDVVLGNVAGDQNPALEGELVANGGAMQFAEAGNYRVTLNMQDYTYTVELIPAVSELYVLGAFNEWNFDIAQRIYATGTDPNYTGMVIFGDKAAEGWKISTEGWATSWGTDFAEAEPATVVLTSDNGANIACYSALGYKFNFNRETAELSVLNTFSKWGIVGDATSTGWGDAPDQAMTLANDGTQCYLTITADLTAGGFKFRANDDWAVNYGDTGADGTLEEGGDNIAVAEAGTYVINFYFNSQVPTYTMTKQ